MKKTETVKQKSGAGPFCKTRVSVGQAVDLFRSETGLTLLLRQAHPGLQNVHVKPTMGLLVLCASSSTCLQSATKHVKTLSQMEELEWGTVSQRLLGKLLSKDKQSASKLERIKAQTGAWLFIDKSKMLHIIGNELQELFFVYQPILPLTILLCRD